MRLCKRLLAALLMLVLSVSVLVIPASAAGWKYDRAYQQYKGKTYTVFGDSIPTGYDPTRKPVLYGFGDGVNPNAYPERVASVTGTKIAQYAYDGCRTKDVLMMLGGNVKKDRYYEQFLEAGIFAAAKRVPPKASVVKKSLKKSSLVTFNVGNNDILTGPLIMAGLDIEKVSDVSTKAAELVQQAVKRGLLTKDFEQLFTTLNTLGITAVYLSAMFAEMEKAFAEMTVAFPQVIATVKANSDAEIAVVGMFNPFRNVDTEVAGLNLSQMGDMGVNMVNTYFKSNAAVLGYTYVNVTKTECFYDVGGTDVHPTPKGHSYMAKQILKAIPHK
jgi:hypothetical protein